MTKLTWIGHACFRLETAGGTMIFDPYSDGSVPGLGNVRECADLVVCSHGHGDHNAVSCVTLTGAEPEGLDVKVFDTWHDEVQGAKRGPNKIHIVTVKDGEKTYTVAHLGDLGCALTKEQREALHGVDVMMIPVGGFFTIGPKEALQVIRETEPKMIIPMHYRDDKAGVGYDVIGTVREFTDWFCGVEYSNESSVTVGEDLSGKVVVLKPAMLG